VELVRSNLLNVISFIISSCRQHFFITLEMYECHRKQQSGRVKIWKQEIVKLDEIIAIIAWL